MVLAITVTTSCSDDNDDEGGNDSALFGTWGQTELEDDYEYSVSITFKSNATGTIISTETFEGEIESDTDNFTWSTEGTFLTLVLDEETEIASYSISGDELRIDMDSDGEIDVIFIKE